MTLRACFPSRFSLAAGLLLAVCLSLCGGRAANARACVWKVTDDAGHTLYLAGSIHALRDMDYPLPPEYDQAFAASSALAFETDMGATSEQFARGLGQAAQLPRGVTLRDRVDPRTYAYVLRVLSKVHGATDPEKKIEHLRPWALGVMLNSPKADPALLPHRAGIEGYLYPRGLRAKKKMEGLVPFKDHIAVFGGMSDTDNEIFLLHAFVHLDTGTTEFANTAAAWKKGDSDAIDRMFRQEYADAPSIRQRIIVDRNNLWMPKVEGYLHSGRTWMVVAGAAHMSGSDGLPAMLRARGYQMEQF